MKIAGIPQSQSAAGSSFLRSDSGSSPATEPCVLVAVVCGVSNKSLSFGESHSPSALRKPVDSLSLIPALARNIVHVSGTSPNMLPAE